MEVRRKSNSNIGFLSQAPSLIFDIRMGIRIAINFILLDGGI